MKRQKDTSDQKQSDRGKQSSQHKGSNQERVVSNARENPTSSLHHSVGNQAIQHLYQEGHIQTKLSVSQPRDDDEREADQVADQVMRMSTTESPVDSGIIQRSSQQGSSGETTIDGETEKQIKSVTSGGKPLPPAARSFFEPRFGRDFSDVTIHRGQSADTATRALQADAFTVGQDIVFRSGAYQPGTPDSRHLLAHELTHVLQQQTTRVSTVQRQESKGTGEHPDQKPSVEEFINKHSGVFGLDEQKLGQELVDLVWQSSSHGEFVKSVLDELDSGNREQVARAFAKSAKERNSIKNFGMSKGGRTALRSVALALPDESALASTVKSAIEKGRERERKAAKKRLEQQEGSESVTFYPAEPMGLSQDKEAEKNIKEAAEESEEKGETIAHGITQFNNIHEKLSSMAEDKGRTAFVRVLDLQGHGGIFKKREGAKEGAFKAGNQWVYTSDLEKYKTGKFAKYMLPGATIQFKACRIAKGEKGKEFLGEVGRIFFGNRKKGYIKADTRAMAPIGGSPAWISPETFVWPQDF